VLSPDIELVDLDGRHWANWWALLWPPGLDQRLGIVLVFVEDTDGDVDGDGQQVRAVRLGEGRVEIDWKGTSVKSMAAMRRALGAGILLVLDTRALPAVFGDFEAELRADDDYVGQLIAIWQAIKRAHKAGLIHMDPPLLDVLPAPGADALQRTFDLLIPDNSALIAYVMETDGPQVHASIIASKDGGDVVFATTHLGIDDEVGGKYLAHDWRKRYKRVNEVVESRYDPPSVAVYVDRAAIDRVLTGPVDQLSREIAQKNVIIDPAPLWLSALLGGAAVAGAATRGAKSLSRLVPRSARRMAQSMAKQAGDRLKDAGLDPWEMLGFNPIEVFHELRAMFITR
jgi:hypothetical protein